MDKWMQQIEALGGVGLRWAGPLDDQRQIVELLKGIGADPELMPHDTAYLLGQVKRRLGCDKGVSRELVRFAAAEAFPHLRCLRVGSRHQNSQSICRLLNCSTKNTTS